MEGTRDWRSANASHSRARDRSSSLVIAYRGLAASDGREREEKTGSGGGSSVRLEDQDDAVHSDYKLVVEADHDGRALKVSASPYRRCCCADGDDWDGSYAWAMAAVDMECHLVQHYCLLENHSSDRSIRKLDVHVVREEAVYAVPWAKEVRFDVGGAVIVARWCMIAISVDLHSRRSVLVPAIGAHFPSAARCTSLLKLAAPAFRCVGALLQSPSIFPLFLLLSLYRHGRFQHSARWQSMGSRPAQWHLMSWSTTTNSTPC